ncbi:TAXI family TRAP transporter solute-binding subunit [Cloacibacillus evryensis]|uniref:TAXI family TRAP transporter solute-binding subunit n=1 Tax=Cloacibacillus evryensis TaxID=508460 RepID=UPI00370CFE9B
MMMKKIFACLVLFAVVLTASAGFAADGYKRAPKQRVVLNLAAGGTSGSWYSVFASIAEIVNKDKNCNITLKVVPGGGTSNPAVVGMGQADLGLLYGSFGLAARNGASPYDTKYGDLYAVTGGFLPMSLEISTLKKSNFTSFKDAICGKKAARFLTGIKSTSTGWYFDRILEFYKTDADNIKKRGGSIINVEYGDWPQMATDGHIDVMFNHIGIPSSILKEISTAREVVLLDMPEELIQYFQKEHAMQKVTIPEGTYSFQKKDIVTVCSPTILAVNKKVSADVVYTLLEVLEKYEKDVKKIHPAMNKFSIAQSVQSAALPLHEGAKAFFKDKGLLR